MVPDLARGLRAAIATIVPFFLAHRTGLHWLSWVALGGWLSTLADPGGLRSQRARLLLAFAIAGALIVLICEQAAAVAALTLALIAFACSIARVGGAAATGAGTLLVVVAAIAVGGGSPAEDAGGFFAGALWGTLLSSVVWPIWSHLPVRIPLAECFRSLAAYATALDAMDAHVEQSDPRWAAIAREHQSRTRAAIEAARAIALASRARKLGESVVGSNIRALLALAERTLPLLAARNLDLESMKERTPLGVAPALESVADMLAAPVLRVHPVLPASGSTDRITVAVEMCVQIASNLGQPPRSDVPQLVAVSPARTMLSDALRPSSTYFHHALRVAIAVFAAQLAGEWLSPSHVAWVTIPMIGVLQPYAGATAKRAAERVIGTVLGSLIAVAIMFLFHSPLALALVMIPLSAASVATKPRSYRLFTLFLTPVFVLLAERFDGDWWTAAARAGDAVVGGAVALAAAMILKSREEPRLDAAIATMMGALRTYASAVFAAHVANTPSAPPVIAARRDVGVTLGEAEASLERLLSEPLRSEKDAEDAMLRVTNARRFANALTALDHSALRDASAARRVGAAIDDALADESAERIIGISEGPELTRVARQAALLVSAAPR
jgi:uncharacterized membrane protein YccC